MTREEQKQTILQQFKEKLGTVPKSLSIGNELIKWSEYIVVSIDGIDILLGPEYILGRFRNYVEHWGVDSNMQIAEVIVRAYRAAVGNPDTEVSDLPMSVAPNLKLHVQQNLLTGVEIRQEVKSDQLSLFPDQKQYHTYTLMGEPQLVGSL